MKTQRIVIHALTAVLLALLVTGCPEKPGEEDEKLPDINGPQAADELRVWNEEASVRVEWQQPLAQDSLFNRDLLGFMIVRSEGAPSYTQPTREEIYAVGDALGEQTVVAAIETEPVGDLERDFVFVDEDVTPGVTYFYQMFGLDEVPNYSDPIPFEATPGGMVQARLSHTQTRLDDGRVLLAGGLGYGGPLESGEVFDPVSETFEGIDDLMTRTRFGHTATLLNDGRVLIAGGYEEGFLDTLDTAEVFDPADNSFRRVDSKMSVGRALHTATPLDDGSVLLVGGTDGVKGFTQADLFDPATETFTPVEDTMTSARYGHAATSLGDTNPGMVMLSGGTDGEKTDASATFFDASDLGFARFVPVPEDEEDPMVAGRLYHTATLLADGRVALVGGFSGELASGEPTDLIEIFDPGVAVFAEAARLEQARSGHTAALLPDGRVVVIGGIDPDFVILDSTEVFDADAETVAAGPALARARTVAELTILDDGRFFIAGGNRESDPFLPAPISTAEVLDPATLVFTSVP